MSLQQRMIASMCLLAGSLACAQPSHAPRPAVRHVLNGIDVLEKEHFATLAKLAAKHGGHLRIGLLTNHVGYDIAHRRTIDILAKDAAAAVPGVSVNAIFSPEHGINGVFDKPGIGNDKDAATGLTVTSLFGTTEESRHPSPEQMKGLDAIVVDLQEVGVRYWTYDTLTTYFVAATAKLHMEMVVLDRPNPIGGVAVQGPLSDAGRENYINAMVEPVRTGLTMGELATFVNGDRKLGASLTVIKAEGWHRSDWWDETGLLWINPSPNLRSLTEAILYPGIGLLEGTNLSVGRGTDTPFEWIGASWIDALKLSDYLNERRIPGVRFIPVRFTVDASSRYPYHGEVCQGVEFHVTDRAALDSPELGIEVAAAVYKLFPKDFQVDRFDRLMLNKSVLEKLKQGADPRTLRTEWTASYGDYLARRKKYLLYQ